MAITYILGEKMVEASREEIPEGSIIVEVLSEDEFEDRNIADEAVRNALAAMLLTESCYVDELPNCIVGSMAVPDKHDLMGDRDLFSYYLDDEKLVFIDEGKIAESTLRQLAKTDFSHNLTTASCFCEFLRELVTEDANWLGDLEDKMEDAEEAMLDHNLETSSSEITAYRRSTIRMTTYYQQLAAMIQTIASNENDMLNRGEQDRFERIMSKVDRLAERSQTIRDYSLQLRELYQTNIDMRQNNVMQLLTIVTVTITPLTLVAGWFGMNFANMPGINDPWGFPFVCIFCVLMTSLLLIWFKRKNWL